jgi:hypothetical protein
VRSVTCSLKSHHHDRKLTSGRAGGDRRSETPQRPVVHITFFESYVAAMDDSIHVSTNFDEIFKIRHSNTSRATDVYRG